MTCQHCGEPLPENAAFCPACGTTTGITRGGAFASDAALRDEIAAELRNLKEERKQLQELRKELETIRCGDGNGDAEPQNASEDDRQDELNCLAPDAADEEASSEGAPKIEYRYKSMSEIVRSIVRGLWTIPLGILGGLVIFSIYPGVIACTAVIVGFGDLGSYTWVPFACVVSGLVLLRLSD